MSDPTTPVSPAADQPAPPVVYRPLSLLAVVGAGLAGLFTAIVVLGGVVAFFRGDPWLLHGAWALLPITAAVLSVLGLFQIQRSEGTLAGEKVARWGLLLSVLVGLSYWAYVGATYFAIGQEAEKFGQDFLTKLANHNLPSAFRDTLPPEQRPPEDPTNPAELRAQVERRFNTPGGEGGPKGMFTTFSQAQFVRMLGIGGPTTGIESLGIDRWEYVGGGYQVRMLYLVKTPLTSFTMDMLIQGKEGKRSQGRQWYVVWDKSGMRRDTSVTMTDEGKTYFTAAENLQEHVMRTWLDPLDKGRTEDVFLQTRLPAEREAARKTASEWRLSLLLADAVGSGALPCATPGAVAARVALGADPDLGRLASLRGLDAFLAGDLVRADKDVFWAPDEIREEIIKLARELFRHPGGELAVQFAPDASAHMPFVRREGDRVVFEQDTTMRLPYGAPRYSVDSRLLLDCDAAELAAGWVKSWRVLGVQLVSGKSLPAGQQTGPGGLPMMGRRGAMPGR
jgi:hypothetical protein